MLHRFEAEGVSFRSVLPTQSLQMDLTRPVASPGSVTGSEPSPERCEQIHCSTGDRDPRPGRAASSLVAAIMFSAKRPFLNLGLHFTGEGQRADKSGS